MAETKLVGQNYETRDIRGKVSGRGDVFTANV